MTSLLSHSTQESLVCCLSKIRPHNSYSVGDAKTQITILCDVLFQTKGLLLLLSKESSCQLCFVELGLSVAQLLTRLDCETAVHFGEEYIVDKRNYMAKATPQMCCHPLFRWHEHSSDGCRDAFPATNGNHRRDYYRKCNQKMRNAVKVSADLMQHP